MQYRILYSFPNEYHLLQEDITFSRLKSQEKERRKNTLDQQECPFFHAFYL
ncbi:hypothetical protein BQ1740_3799 [Bacillus subtilis]|nr:hypothetical protein BQ1740_3799 [Bacillus subtilis]